MLEIGAALGTTIGEVRQENQDRAVIARLPISENGRTGIVAVVCDGMGGMVDGSHCAEIGIAHFPGSLGT